MISIKTDILVVGPENQNTGNVFTVQCLWKTVSKPLILTLKVMSITYEEQLFNNFKTYPKLDLHLQLILRNWFMHSSQPG